MDNVSKLRVEKAMVKTFILKITFHPILLMHYPWLQYLPSF